MMRVRAPRETLRSVVSMKNQNGRFEAQRYTQGAFLKYMCIAVVFRSKRRCFQTNVHRSKKSDNQTRGWSDKAQ
jgi:hypothetical protein